MRLPYFVLDSHKGSAIPLLSCFFSTNLITTWTSTESVKCTVQRLCKAGRRLFVWMYFLQHYPLLVFHIFISLSCSAENEHSTVWRNRLNSRSFQGAIMFSNEYTGENVLLYADLVTIFIICPETAGNTDLSESLRVKIGWIGLTRLLIRN